MLTTCTMRHSFVLIHRYVNLAIMLFLVIAGITGSILAYNTELERVFAPALFATPQDANRLSLAELANRVENLVPNARMAGVSMLEPDQVGVAFVPDLDPATGERMNLGFTEFFADPWTGKELGRRKRGDLSEGMINIMPFIYISHFSLMAGNAGSRFFGIVALIWTIDCFIGLYLTLPSLNATFLARWAPAWLIKTRASLYRVNFDIHRASGLWTWPLLFILAWSSVMFNLRSVYEPVTSLLFAYESPRSVFQSLPRNHVASPALNWYDAERIGASLIQQYAAEHKFQVREALGLHYMPPLGAYRYEVRTSLDVFERAPKGGSTYVLFDGNTGTPIRFFAPTGQLAGNTVESWLYALHMCRVFGQTLQFVIFVIGVVMAAMSITGLIIWLKKRKSRRFHTQRALKNRL